MVTCVCRDLGNSGRLECRRCAGGRLELPEPGTGTWHCRAWAGAERQGPRPPGSRGPNSAPGALSSCRRAAGPAPPPRGPRASAAVPVLPARHCGDSQSVQQAADFRQSHLCAYYVPSCRNRLQGLTSLERSRACPQNTVFLRTRSMTACAQGGALTSSRGCAACEGRGGAQKTRAGCPLGRQWVEAGGRGRRANPRLLEGMRPSSSWAGESDSIAH